MIIREITTGDKKAFNAVALHPLQSFEWGEFREQTGIQVIRRAIYKDKKLITPIQITIHPLPKLNWNIGYFPKGPLPNRDQLKLLGKIGKKNRCIFIKLEPNHIDSSEGKTQIFLKKNNCRPGRPLFTRYTWQLNLDQSEEELLKNMHHKTRYNIRLAQRKGVKVAVDDSQQSFEWFIRLLFDETVSRQGFYAHTPDYFRKLWKVLQPAGMAHLLRAYYGKETLAVFMVFVFNNWLYYPYGGSTRKHKNLMAANLLMWEIIKFGKKQGCHWFDMWGALGPDANSKDPWYGFHRYKRGYGGKLVEFLGSYDLVIKPKLYAGYQITDSLRWKFLKSKTEMKKMPQEMKNWQQGMRTKIKWLGNEILKDFE